LISWLSEGNLRSLFVEWICHHCTHVLINTASEDLYHVFEVTIMMRLTTGMTMVVSYEVIYLPRFRSHLQIASEIQTQSQTSGLR
jgi:uncharacterized protein (DUF983 family)